MTKFIKVRTKLIFALFLFSFTSLSAQIVPVCISEKYSNCYNDNQKWNTLLDKACEQLKLKKFPEAYKTLTEALIIDSVSSNGNVNAYIEVQHRRLRNYLKDLSQNANVEETNQEVAQPKAKVINVEESKPIENSVAANIEIKKVEETPTVEIKENIEPKETIIPVVEVKVDSIVSISKVEGTKTKIGDDEIKFTENDKFQFQEKGMQKVKQLESFVFQIGSKTTVQSLAMQSIAGAVKLFDNEERTVQVSSISSSEKRKSKIRTYLNKLRMLNYEDVKIEWADFQYASDFIKGRDGNYYGYIVFQQRFTATSIDKQKVYSDLTTKKIEVILKIYEKAEQGKITENWDIFLGDISVVQTSN